MGAGRGRLAAGAASRRCRGKARRRPLRRARRQDGATGACRRLGRRRRRLEHAAQAARRQSRAARAHGGDGRGRCRRLAPEERFDAILLDAPCSSTGTIRRHPDIPYLKTPRDIEELAAVQTRLLDNAASLLKPGGTLVYSTCSLEPDGGRGPSRRAYAPETRKFRSIRSRARRAVRRHGMGAKPPA